MLKLNELLTRNYNSAEQILKENRDILESMKDALMKYETIDALQIDDLMARSEVRDTSRFYGSNQILIRAINHQKLMLKKMTKLI